ncbi:DUF2089 domain-containing protein [Acetivibrio clariflavus]|uniref:DUF2089 domain-containing protein n=1 Tax=Acetivibrio clariflavus (strain DSM 19732 / NBRC 101661 / EBR45) TaxID=720554 RepID=G8M1U1_ACECE|nr:DUF2089 domain-containing protein [Acetivibrio clariflavus]AEV67024.1 hypothetical protein Clocl_0283 [Acetivibrio clariflavus DSM 19732]HOQ01691.1 DUF2089 domain-containing protein [Acetivibrio clariflavus]HPU42535.1 DUF2089 domain-containing protein [Acetivibrio clariflavus]
MGKEVLGKCPVCNSETIVTKISCENCNTTIEGEFTLCKFCRLTAEQKQFIDTFIKCRGNIKEMEKELGVSYPTVKNRLEDVAAALGHKPQPIIEDDGRKKEILERLNAGEISFDEAMELLKG